MTQDDIGRARELFAKALETPGGLRIETIHAFCGRVLRRFPLEAGVAPGFSELDDDDAADLWDAAFRAMGRRVVRGDAALMEAARTAAEAGGGKGLDIVRDLLPRRAAIQRYIDAGRRHRRRRRPPARSISSAPTHRPTRSSNSAMGADLPREALQDLLRPPCPPAASPTQTSPTRIAIRPVGCAPPKTASPPTPRVCLHREGRARRKQQPLHQADAAEARARRRRLFFQMKDVPQGSGDPSHPRRRRSASTPRACSSAPPPSCASPTSLFADFADRKRARAGLDFDDLIETTARLLTRRHAAEWVLWKLDGGISHILLDEAQDTSPAQWRILKALTDDIFAGAGAVRDDPRTLFVVGDQKQSIYSFQGADPEHFLREKQDFRDQRAAAPRSAYALPDLAMSFRSAPEVLAYVDDVFDTDVFAARRALHARCRRDAADLLRHTPFRRNEAGSVELWPLEPKRRSRTRRAVGCAARRWRTKASPKARLAARIASFIKARDRDRRRRLGQEASSAPPSPATSSSSCAAAPAACSMASCRRSSARTSPSPAPTASSCSTASPCRICSTSSASRSARKTT